MTYLVPYVAVLVVFGIIDAGWLNTMGKILYRPALGDILLDDLRIAPAILFYLAYPIGIVAFAVMPGLRSDSVATVVFLRASVRRHRLRYLRSDQLRDAAQLDAADHSHRHLLWRAGLGHRGDGGDIGGARFHAAGAYS